MIKPAGSSFEMPFDEPFNVEEEQETVFTLEEFETGYEPVCDEELCEEFRSECDTFFAPGGLLESRAADENLKCELRPQQRAMANAIADALCEGEHLCVEAPTGVGKSFSYLVPLVYRAKRKCRPAVISTETIVS
jgi:ATP-dependent DNA helicase DinG